MLLHTSMYAPGHSLGAGLGLHLSYQWDVRRVIVHLHGRSVLGPQRTHCDVGRSNTFAGILNRSFFGNPTVLSTSACMAPPSSIRVRRHRCFHAYSTHTASIRTLSLLLPVTNRCTSRNQLGYLHARRGAPASPVHGQFKTSSNHAVRICCGHDLLPGSVSQGSIQ